MNSQRHLEQFALELEQTRSQHFKDFLEIITAERATASTLIDAARRSAKASTVKMWLVLRFGEYREITDPCSNRTFLVAAFSDKLYLLEEIT